ncbi:MAG TPA: transposase [Kofleriaceae bacterium]|nr:transposase [Kofleriaceae bacterium]
MQGELFPRRRRRKRSQRKPTSVRAGARHEVRPDIKPRDALHVVMRVVPSVGSMRRRALYKAIRDATITAALRERFRIVHVSIQRTHVHMLVEATSKEALARGMQGFQISAARYINTALQVDKYRRRRGRVFADRYHLEVITSPTRAHHVLSYVLNNWPNTRKTDKDSQAHGWSIHSRPGSRFPTGRSSTARLSCGRFERPTIR